MDIGKKLKELRLQNDLTPVSYTHLDVYKRQIYNGVEYDFEIDANSGTILEWSEERD